MNLTSTGIFDKVIHKLMVRNTEKLKVFLLQQILFSVLMATLTVLFQPAKVLLMNCDLYLSGWGSNSGMWKFLTYSNTNTWCHLFFPSSRHERLEWARPSLILALFDSLPCIESMPYPTSYLSNSSWATKGIAWATVQTEFVKDSLPRNTEWMLWNNYPSILKQCQFWLVNFQLVKYAAHIS